MLEFNLQQAPLRLGLAEGVDPHQVPFGTLTTAENVRWERSGRLQKRYGVTSLSTSKTGGGGITSAQRIVTRGNELALITPASSTNQASMYRYANGGWTLTANNGQLPDVGLTWSTIEGSAEGIASSDIGVTSDGKIVHAWIQGDPNTTQGGWSTGIFMYQVIDKATGAVITPPTMTSRTGDVSTQVRVLISGTSWIILYNPNQTAMKAVVNGNAPVTLVSSTIATVFDACVIGTNFVIAYGRNATGITLTSYTIATTPAQQVTNTIAATAGATFEAISIDGVLGEVLWVAYTMVTSGGAVRTIYLATVGSSTLLPFLAPTSMYTVSSVTESTVVVSRYDSSNCLLSYSAASASAGTNSYDGLFQSLYVTSAGAITSFRSLSGIRLTSRTFKLGPRWYAFVTNYSTAGGFSLSWPLFTGSDSYLVDCTPGATTAACPARYVGKVDVLIGGMWTKGAFCTPSPVSATEFICVLPYLSAAPAVQNRGWVQGVRIVSATVGASMPMDTWKSVNVGPEVYLSSGLLTAYDGRMAFDFGWSNPPTIEQQCLAHTTGGTMATGNYIYAMAPEYTSKAGVLHRGPTSIPKTFAITGPTGSFQLYLVESQLSQKHDETLASEADSPVLPHLAIYRSVANGTLAQRLTADPLDNVWVQSISSNPFLDIRADTSVTGAGSGAIALSQRPYIYTAGGELDDYSPPSSMTLTTFQNRLWSISGDKRTIWISKDFIANPGIAPGFHPTIVMSFASNLTAMATMDDKLVVFGANSIWCVVGTGPNPNGQGATWDSAVVQSDVGCINPRSVVSFQGGVIFQSVRGLYVISRSLEVTWIGRQIKDLLAAYPNITSAVVVAASNEIRWTANNVAGSAGVVLVYNYVENQWSTSKYTIGGVYGAPIVDACIWLGNYVMAAASGYVAVENQSSFLDDTSWVPMTIETAWISATGPLAYQSVRTFAMEGVSISDHDLTVSVGFNNATSYAETKTFVAGTTGVTAVGPLESCEISIGPQRKCQSIRFKIQDATPTGFSAGTGQGPTIDMIGIEVGIKKGFVPKSSVQVG